MYSAFSIAMFDYQRVILVEPATKITKVFGNLGHSLISPLVIHEQSWNHGEELPNFNDFNASPIFSRENPPSSPKTVWPRNASECGSSSKLPPPQSLSQKLKVNKTCPAPQAPSL